MEKYNKYNINNLEYNQKYYNNNKNSSINNIGNIHDEILNNKESNFQKNSTNNSPFKKSNNKQRN